MAAEYLLVKVSESLVFRGHGTGTGGTSEGAGGVAAAPATKAIVTWE